MPFLSSKCLPSEALVKSVVSFSGFFVNSLPLREVCRLHIVYLKLGVSFPLGQSETVFITISSISDDPGNCPEFQLVACLNWSEPLSSTLACLALTYPFWKA